MSLEVIPIWVISARTAGFWHYLLRQDLYLVGWLVCSVVGWLAGWLRLVLLLAGYLGWLSCLAGSRCFLLSNTNLGHSLPKHVFLELLSMTG